MSKFSCLQKIDIMQTPTKTSNCWKLTGKQALDKYAESSKAAMRDESVVHGVVTELLLGSLSSQHFLLGSLLLQPHFVFAFESIWKPW